MNLFKKSIRKILNRFGIRTIQTSRTGNKQDVVTLDTYYRYYPKESVRDRCFYNFGGRRIQTSMLD